MSFLARYGKELDREKEEKKRLGMTQKDSAAIIVNDYELPLTPDQFIKEITPLYRERFEEAAKKICVDAVNCLVIEDSLVGVKAANAAKMKIVAVPSRREADCHGLANVVLHSLLEFQPELWGLPPFDDWLDNTLPIDPIHLSGLYVSGCLEEATENATLVFPDQAVGLYFGWAKVDTDGNFKILVSINIDFSCVGYKRIHVYLIDANSDLKHKQKMQIHLVGYIRAWDNKEFTSTELEKLEEYKSIARASLDLPSFTCL
ncbi:Putative pseudouridine-5'-monophosphatase [Glycine soja]|nr:Putative pseudouridine-5'-monophosphatase [Glycine soja]